MANLKGINMNDDLIPMMKPSQCISKTFASTEYNLYLHGEISHNADEYLEHFAVYHQAGPDDLIRLWIQSPGGSVAVGNQYIQHMKRCPATIVAVIGMGTASEGTAICLAADDWEVDEMSTFLVHGFSYGTYGHEAQVYNTATFNKKLNERSLRSTYSGFLTEEEIIEALKGVDLLFDGEELLDKLQAFREYRQSQPCNCGNPACERSPENMALLGEEEDFEEMPTFEEMVESAVTRALEQYEKKKADAEKKAARKKPSAKTQKALDEARVKTEAFKESQKPE